MKPQRTAVFIDGANVHATVNLLGFQIDYNRLLEFYKDSNLLRVLYFTALPPKTQDSRLRRMSDYIEYNGLTLITKETKTYAQSDGLTKIKGNMDVEMAVHALNLSEHISDMVLFSGDGDFRILVEEMQRRGVRVAVVSSMKTDPPMISDDLRRQADVFIDLFALRDKLERKEENNPQPTKQPGFKRYGVQTR